MIVIIIGFSLFGCSPTLSATLGEQTNDQGEKSTPTAALPSIQEETPDRIDEGTSGPFTPTPTPDPFSNLYGCEMEVEFNSGPLESKSINVSVLDQDYFFDKGNQFFPGKGTSVYYKEQHHFIMHSSYVNGNILRPMEAEFIRKYLEYWGETGNVYIEDRMDQLNGSEVTWICNGKPLFETAINGIIRLSHKASDDLWQEPEQLEQIIEDREGLVSEWVGGFDRIENANLYIGFCGWGQEALGEARYTYYRYLIRFEIVETFNLSEPH